MRVFTDGACSGNGYKKSKAGCGIYFEDGQKYSLTVNEAKNLSGITEQIEQTNNTGELLAILVALKIAKNKTESLVICTDSMYSINSITIWSKNWIKNGWKTANGLKVKNRIIIENILDVKRYFKAVIFLHVNSHQQEPKDVSCEEYKVWYGNFIADELAKKAIS